MKFIKHICICSTILGTSISHLYSQQSFTLYGMNALEQRLQLNPAFIPDYYKVHVGLPVLSSNYIGIGNSGFKYADLIQKGSDDSLHLNMNNLIGKLKKSNYLSMTVNVDLLTVGIRIKNSYYNLNITEKFNTRFRYPKDFLAFVWYGNGNEHLLGENLNFNFGIDITAYTEYGVGYAQTILDNKLTVGGKLKYLSGIVNFQTKKSDIFLHTDANDIYNISASGDIALNGSGMTKNDEGDLEFNAMNNFPFGFKNNGFGLDLGAKYQLTENIEINGSVTDIGYIKWKTDVVNFTSANPGNKITFSGLDFSDYVTEGSDSSAGSGLTNLLDTVIKNFELDTTFNSYKTKLVAQYRIGGSYNLPFKQIVGGQFYFNRFDGKFVPGVSVYYNKQLGDRFTGILSYSAYNRSANNIGVGLRVNSSSAQLYFITDNLLAIFVPTKAKYFTFMSGLNITVGRINKKKKEVKEEAQSE